MINLLSKHDRAELAAARRNIKLRQYVVLFAIIGGLVAASYTIAYIILDAQTKAYRADIESLKPQQAEYKDVVKEATAYSENLKTARTIFDSEFTFSSLLTTLARILPSNAVLADFNLSVADLNKPIILTFRVKTTTDADKVKLALQNSPYFKDTKIRIISYQPEYLPYTYTVTIITTLDKPLFQKTQQAGTL